MAVIQDIEELFLLVAIIQTDTSRRSVRIGYPDLPLALAVFLLWGWACG